VIPERGRTAALIVDGCAEPKVQNTMPRVRSGSVCATLSAIRIQSESRSRRTFAPARARTMRSAHAFRPAAQNGLDADLSDTDLLQDPLGVDIGGQGVSAFP
jgi:hypothetical protein